MIDLRPYKSEWFVEIVSKDSSVLAGQFIGKEEGLIDDEMSDKAISEVIQRDWFKKESKEFFEYTYYWDTFDQMFEYVSTSWSNLISMPKNVLSNARKIELEMGETSQLRIRRRILIASYRKSINNNGISK